MALGAKQSSQIHNKTGADLAAMKTKYDNGVHLEYIGFDEVDMMLHQMQLMQNDIDELRRFVADASELRTIVSPLPIANGGTGLTASQPLIYSEITITAGEMASLHTTRKTLVAAQGANTMIVPVSCMIRSTKLNVGVMNSTLTNVFVGYGDDSRDLIQLSVMNSKGLLFRKTHGGTLHVPAVGSSTGDTSQQDDEDCVDVELAMILTADPGVNGASASKVSLLYYVATTT